MPDLSPENLEPRPVAPKSPEKANKPSVPEKPKEIGRPEKQIVDRIKQDGDEDEVLEDIAVMKAGQSGLAVAKSADQENRVHVAVEQGTVLSESELAARMEEVKKAAGEGWGISESGLKMLEDFITSPAIRDGLKSKGHFRDSIDALQLYLEKGPNKDRALQVVKENIEAIGENTSAEDMLASHRSLDAVSRLGEEDAEIKANFFREHSGVIRTGLIENPHQLDEYADDLVQFGEPEDVAEVARNILTNLDYVPNKGSAHQQLSSLIDSPYFTAVGVGEEIVDSYFSRYNLDPNTLNDWYRSRNSAYGEVVSSNLEVVAELETERPGIASFLKKEFNITDFARYPKELLVKQFDEFERTDLPYGVVLYPKKDYNGAFYQTKEALEGLAKGVEGNFAVRIFEADSKYDIARVLIKLERKYGPNHKISFALIAGHGTEGSIKFGGKEERNKLRLEDLKGRGVQRTSEFFEPNPNIILVSCSTGAKEGIAQHLSEMMGAKVIAPDRPSNITGIEAKIKDGHLDFDVNYQEEESEMVYAKGEEISRWEERNAEPEVQEDDKKIATSVEGLPKLREGYVRVVHVTSNPNSVEQIPQTGLNYEQQGMLQSTARVFSKEEDVEFFHPEDPRFTHGWSFVFDLPAEESKLHENVAKSPGVVPAKYLVGVIEKQLGP